MLVIDDLKLLVTTVNLLEPRSTLRRTVVVLGACGNVLKDRNEKSASRRHNPTVDEYDAILLYSSDGYCARLLA